MSAADLAMLHWPLIQPFHLGTAQEKVKAKAEGNKEKKPKKEKAAGGKFKTTLFAL